MFYSFLWCLVPSNLQIVQYIIECFFVITHMPIVPTWMGAGVRVQGQLSYAVPDTDLRTLLKNSIVVVCLLKIVQRSPHQSIQSLYSSRQQILIYVVCNLTVTGWFELFQFINLFKWAGNEHPLGTYFIMLDLIYCQNRIGQH